MSFEKLKELGEKHGFEVPNNIDEFKYHDINAKFSVNNFVTSFKYIEEKDATGDQHYLQNKTSYHYEIKKS